MDRHLRSRPRSGFTLIELLVVLVMLGCLAALGWFAARQVMIRKQCKRNLFAIYNALAGSKELFPLQAGHFDHAGTGAEDARLLDALAYFFNRD